MRLFVVALCLWLVDNSSAITPESCKNLYNSTRCFRNRTFLVTKPQDWWSNRVLINWLDQTLFLLSISNCSADTNGWRAVCLDCDAARCAKTTAKFKFSNGTTYMTVGLKTTGRQGTYPSYSANVHAEDLIPLKEFPNPVVMGRKPTTSKFFNSLKSSISLFALCIICAALVGLFVWIFVSITFLPI